MNKVSKENTCWLYRIFRRFYVWAFNPVEAGQIWVSDLQGNPFTQKYIVYFDVLDVKEGLVKYILRHENGRKSEELIETSYFFKIGMKRIK